MTSSATERLAGLVRSTLLSIEVSAGPAERIAPELLGAAEQSRLGGVLQRAVELGAADMGDGDTGTDTDAFDEWRRGLLHRSVVIERSMIRAIDTLRRAGVRPIVLKGVAVAHLDYPDPAIRSFGDVDLLVHPDQIDTAVRALLDAGGSRDLPPRTERWDRDFAKDIPITDRFGVEIDLHRTLVRGPFGAWIDLDELHADPQPFTVAGTTLHALAPPARAMHAAYALTIAETDPRLAHAVDLHLVARRLPDPAGLTALADRWRATSILREAIDTATRLTGVVPVTADGGTVAATGVEHRDEARARATYRTGGGTNAAELLGVWDTLTDWPTRLAYLRALALPRRAYTRARRAAGRPSERRAAVEELLRRSPMRRGRR